MFSKEHIFDSCLRIGRHSDVPLLLADFCRDLDALLNKGEVKGVLPEDDNYKELC